VVVGHIRLAGSTPLEQVLIKPEGADDVELIITGPYRDELHRLSGAKVRAIGSRVDDNLSVSSYEIQEIGGHTPVVGTLEVRDGVISILQARGAPVILETIPARLLVQAGAKVWVILDANGAVAGYGVIRER
jgi:hypothetical protein